MVNDANYSGESCSVWYQAMYYVKHYFFMSIFHLENFSFWKICPIFSCLRKIIILLPDRFKFLVTDLVAVFVYWPLSRFCRVLDLIGFSATNFPLFYYRNHSIYTMRTDARDRFGTPLEARYKREKIAQMMEESGLQEVKFSDGPPFWCAVGIKR